MRFTSDALRITRGPSSPISPSHSHLVRVSFQFNLDIKKIYYIRTGLSSSVVEQLFNHFLISQEMNRLKII